MRIRFTSVMAVALLSAAQAFAPVRAGEPEHLVFTPLPGLGEWKEIRNESNAEGWIREAVPAGQDASDVKDVLLVRGITNRNSANALDVINDVMKRATAPCENVRVTGPHPKEEYGLKVAYGQVFCGRPDGKDYNMKVFAKVLAGRDATYVVERKLRIPNTSGEALNYSPDQLAWIQKVMAAFNETLLYLTRNVFVCGSSSADVRCRRPARKG